MEIPQDRRFQLWEYHVSHGMALIRSPRDDEMSPNIDVILAGVEYLAVPRHLHQLQLEKASPNEVIEVERLLRKDALPERVWALICDEQRYIVVAAQVVVRESHTDIFDSPFTDSRSSDG